MLFYKYNDEVLLNSNIYVDKLATFHATKRTQSCAATNVFIKSFITQLIDIYLLIKWILKVFLSIKDQISSKICWFINISLIFLKFITLFGRENFPSLNYYMTFLPNM